jgi:hypothetical protein
LLLSEFTLFDHNVESVDVTRDITKNSEDDVDPEVGTASLHEEHTKRREEQDNDNKTAITNHIFCLGKEDTKKNVFGPFHEALYTQAHYITDHHIKKPDNFFHHGA